MPTPLRMSSTVKQPVDALVLRIALRDSYNLFDQHAQFEAQAIEGNRSTGAPKPVRDSERIS